MKWLPLLLLMFMSFASSGAHAVNLDEVRRDYSNMLRRQNALDLAVTSAADAVIALEAQLLANDELLKGLRGEIDQLKVAIEARLMEDDQVKDWDAKKAEYQHLREETERKRTNSVAGTATPQEARAAESLIRRQRGAESFGREQLQQARRLAYERDPALQQWNVDLRGKQLEIDRRMADNTRMRKALDAYREAVRQADDHRSLLEKFSKANSDFLQVDGGD